MTKLLGASVDMGPQQYALYQPVVGRLVLTTSCVIQARQIELLVSGRYHAHVCDLTTASNWHSTLVDNSCCLLWDISDDSVMSAAEPVKVGQLVYRGLPSHDFHSEQTWLQSCQYWLTLMDYVKRQIYPDCARVEFIREMFGHETQDLYFRIQRAEQDLRRGLYFARHDAEQEISDHLRSLVPEFDRIRQEFDAWQK